MARALHRQSPRAERALVSRNAATFPETLIDAELFGNARNFPNPGMPERPGLIGEADGSTLFLDEFAELPHAMQAHLLRVLDDGEYVRLGESRPRRADFRLLAATNRPEHALKEDVLARLRLRLDVCGLDQRREDLPLIARHIMRRLARDDEHIAARYFPGGDPAAIPRMSRAFVGHLVRHPYSTHVREIEAILWRAMSRGQGDVLDIHPGSLTPRTPPPQSDATQSQARPDTSAMAEQPVDPAALSPADIQACLDRHGGRQELVWRALGLSSRHVLRRLVLKYGLRVKAASTEDP